MGFNSAFKGLKLCLTPISALFFLLHVGANKIILTL